LRMQIASGVNVIVQVTRMQDGSRAVSHITEVLGFDIQSSRYQLRDLFVRKLLGVGGDGTLRSELVPTGALPSFMPQLRDRGLDLPGAMYACAHESEPANAENQNICDA